MPVCVVMGIAALHPSYENALSPSRDADRPRFAINFPPSLSEGAGKTGCTLHPRSRVHLHTKNAHTSIQVQRKHSGLPCAMALRLTSCSPRWTALLPPSSLRSLLLKNLTPAPRRQDHTTSPYASGAYVSRHSRPSHLTARSWRWPTPLIRR